MYVHKTIHRTLKQFARQDDLQIAHEKISSTLQQQSIFYQSGKSQSELCHCCVCARDGRHAVGLKSSKHADTAFMQLSSTQHATAKAFWQCRSAAADR